MAMTGAGLKALRQQYVDAVPPVQGNDAGATVAYSEAILLADSQAIVDYIQGNAHAVGTDSGTNGGSTHNLPIE